MPKDFEENLREYIADFSKQVIFEPYELDRLKKHIDQLMVGGDGDKIKTIEYLEHFYKMWYNILTMKKLYLTELRERDKNENK